MTHLAALPMLTYEELTELQAALNDRLRLHAGQIAQFDNTYTGQELNETQRGVRQAIAEQSAIARSLLTAVTEALYRVREGTDE